MMLLVPLAILTANSPAHAGFTYTVDLLVSNEPSAVITTTTGANRPMPFGTAIFAFNDTYTALSFRATVTNIDFTGSQTADTNDNATNAHIHASATLIPRPENTAGVVWGFLGSPFNETAPNDMVLTPFTGGLVGATISGKWDANEGNGTNFQAQLPNLLAGRAYINFHTNQNSGGEIRGFLTPIPEPTSIILSSVGTVGILGLSWLSRKRTRSQPGPAPGV